MAAAAPTGSRPDAPDDRPALPRVDVADAVAATPALATPRWLTCDRVADARSILADDVTAGRIDRDAASWFADRWGIRELREALREAHQRAPLDAAASRLLAELAAGSPLGEVG